MKSRKHFLAYVKLRWAMACRYLYIFDPKRFCHVFVQDNIKNWEDELKSHEKSNFHRAAVSMVSSKNMHASVAYFISSGRTTKLHWLKYSQVLDTLIGKV